MKSPGRPEIVAFQPDQSPLNTAEFVETATHTAWQPITPQGVAAFARAPWRRLLLVQFIIALVIGCSIAWFANHGYLPVISKAIGQLPATGQIKDGQLDWKAEPARILASNNFLAITLDLEHSGQQRTTSHIQFEFGRTDVRVQSLFGYLEIKYPREWIIPANRTELEPLWGAWRPQLLAILILAIVLYLMATWYILATVYAGPAWYLAYFLNRDLSLRGSWRVCGAALLPGALLMWLALSFYALGVMDLVQLGFVSAAHIITGWIYVLLAIHLSPSVTEKSSQPKNPFKS